MAVITEKDIILCGHGSGNPSTKIMYDYLSQRYNQKMSNGLRKGVLYVYRLKALTDTKRKEFHDTYKTILGRNKYSQDLREYVYTKYKDGNYYSDCSSSGCATFKKIGYNVSLLNTVGIVESNLFEKVPVTIKNGHITNPEILKIGDAVLFAGNASRSWCNYLGHVEWVYEINDDLVEEDEDLIDPDEIPVFAPYLGIVNASALNVRLGPGTQYTPTGVLYKKHPVYIVGEENNWGNMQNGWISLKYVTQKKSLTGKVTASNLNVRAAYPDGDVKKIIKKGTTVKITKVNEDGTWGYDSKAKGWVSLKYVSL